MTQCHNIMQSFSEERQSLKQPPKKHLAYHRAFKACICLLLLGGFLTYRFMLPTLEADCIEDAYQKATQKLNRQMVEYPDRGSSFQGNDNGLSITGKILIGIGQVLMDFWIILLCVLWLWKVRNMRAAAGILPFFLTRAIIFLNIEVFPFPDNLVWRSPGFISFTVPYDHTNDFFYSGHTGTLTLIFLELVSLDQKILAIMIGISWIYMLNMLLITKVHYMIDIVGGLIFAVWFYRTGIRITLYFDKFVSLPFLAGKKFYQRCKGNKGEEGRRDLLEVNEREIQGQRGVSETQIKGRR